MIKVNQTNDLVAEMIRREMKARGTLLVNLVSSPGSGKTSLLVCPASYDLGEDIRIVLLSCTGGDDKPKKYPGMFLTTDVMVISKTDLLPHVPFSVQRVSRAVKEVNGQLKVIALPSQHDEGIGEWCVFLLRQTCGACRGLTGFNILPSPEGTQPI